MLGDHPTPSEVYEKVREKHPHISRATVYRNLNLLAERGELAHVAVPNGADRYELRCDPHYHLCCSQCGKIFDAEMPYQADLAERLGDTQASASPVTWSSSPACAPTAAPPRAKRLCAGNVRLPGIARCRTLPERARGRPCTVRVVASWQDAFSPSWRVRPARSRRHAPWAPRGVRFCGAPYPPGV